MALMMWKFLSFCFFNHFGREKRKEQSRTMAKRITHIKTNTYRVQHKGDCQFCEVEIGGIIYPNL